jgi:hypothetical protein
MQGETMKAKQVRKQRRRPFRFLLTVFADGEIHLAIRRGIKLIFTSAL